MEPDNLYPTRRSLLSRLKDWNDQESWRDFFNTYWRLIYGTALRAGLNETEAEEVVQETLVSVAKRMREFKYTPATCSFKTWLHVLTRRRIADHFRKRQRRITTVDLPAAQDTATEPINKIADSASLDSDARWEEDWERNLVQAALDRVKEKVAAEYYQIYNYYVMQTHTVAQTCRALGVSAGRVYLAKHRVAKLLQREVAELRAVYG